MNKQREILEHTAKRHGLTISQAEEIFNLVGAKIAEVISDQDKKVDNLYDPNKFPIIHIDHLGKFIPNQRKIRHANFCLKNKTDEHNT
jgi:hypothetical protein